MRMLDGRARCARPHGTGQRNAFIHAHIIFNGRHLGERKSDDDILIRLVWQIVV